MSASATATTTRTPGFGVVGVVVAGTVAFALVAGVALARR
jgi:hypothetical protein